MKSRFAWQHVKTSKSGFAGNDLIFGVGMLQLKELPQKIACGPIFFRISKRDATSIRWTLRRLDPWELQKLHIDVVRSLVAMTEIESQAISGALAIEQTCMQWQSTVRSKSILLALRQQHSFTIAWRIPIWRYENEMRRQLRFSRGASAG